MPITIAGLADALTASLTRHDAVIAHLSQADTDALDRLARAITYDVREQIAARKRALWFEQAITDPPAGTLTRTVIVDSDAWPPGVNKVALVQRTDTGQHYIVSTSIELDCETFTWRSDAKGVTFKRPGGDPLGDDNPIGDGREENIYVVSGRGMTRAEAITAIDRADASALVPGFPSYDDDGEDESE
jgi:hypothetical protein